MLNYIWLGLIVVAIFVAVGRDIDEESTNRFHNNQALALETVSGSVQAAGPNHFTATTFMTRSQIAQFYGAADAKAMKSDTMTFATDIVQSKTNPLQGTLTLTLPSDLPPTLSDLAATQSDATKLIGKGSFDTATFNAALPAVVRFVPPTVHFRVLSKVANEGILKIADVAVTLALGLIGVMALWLGVMKIAEAAGLVAMLAKAVKPIMVWLFPDVPADHPAMGAMVMNMTANFLGLSNAATPLGLKAMEELNKLNPVAGTATNAMCMFLTINTTALTLVPATVIAIRLTLGSDDPTDIIMPTFLATFISLILGVLFTKLIERFFPIKNNDGAEPVAA
jgi:spore maturation protein A